MSVLISRVKRPVAILGIVLAVILLAEMPPTDLSAEALPSTLELDYLNGVYEDLDSNLEPVRQGSLTIQFSSPEHRLTVHGNQLRLTAQGEGRVLAAFAVDFEGGGQLIADVSGIGRFTDRVEAPRQRVKVHGTVRIARRQGGYLFTVESADPAVELEIQSGVADQIISACRAAAMIPFINLPCGGLETALAFISIPMPGPGEQFLLPSENLTADEAAFFDRFATTE